MARWNSFCCPRYGVSVRRGALTDASAVYEDRHAATSADGGKLTDIGTYETLVTQPRVFGGLKDDSADLVVAGLYAPTTPFYTLTSDDPVACDGAASCTILGHSCSSSTDSTLYGEPAVRLDAVVKGANGLQHTICDDSYDGFANDLLNRIGSQLGNACIPGAIADLQQPDCTVTVGNGPLPRCASGSGPPCWLIEADPGCPTQIDPTDGSGQTLHAHRRRVDRLGDGQLHRAHAAVTVTPGRSRCARRVRS